MSADNLGFDKDCIVVEQWISIMKIYNIQCQYRSTDCSGDDTHGNNSPPKEVSIYEKYCKFIKP